MIHPTHEELSRWYDEGEDPSAPAATHVRACEVCAGYVTGLRELGSAMRAWADDAVPPMAGGGVADAVLAQLGLSEKGAVEAVEAKGAAAVVESVGEKAKLEAVATVHALEPRRKRTRAALWPTLAVAAAALVAFSVRGGRGVAPTSQTASASADPKFGERFLTQMVTPSDDAASQPGGPAEVVSVEVEGEHTLYAVLEVRGEGSLKSFPVVWIEDEATTIKGGKPEAFATEQQ